MSHPAAWACRACRLVLGEVKGGTLRPLVPVEAVDRRGVACVRCPRCGRVRAWVPDGARAAGADRGAASRRRAIAALCEQHSEP
jgi:hypothetical protein